MGDMRRVLESTIVKIARDLKCTPAELRAHVEARVLEFTGGKPVDAADIDRLTEIVRDLLEANSSVRVEAHPVFERYCGCGMRLKRGEGCDECGMMPSGAEPNDEGDEDT